MNVDMQRQIRLFEQAINTADEPLMQTLVDETAPFYTPISPEPLYGAKGFLAVIHLLRSGFPDVQWKLEQTIAENNKIAVQWTCSGTHKHEFMGVPATHNHFSVCFMNIYGFNADGKIISDTAAEGIIGIVRAIGLLKL